MTWLDEKDTSKIGMVKKLFQTIIYFRNPINFSSFSIIKMSFAFRSFYHINRNLQFSQLFKQFNDLKTCYEDNTQYDKVMLYLINIWDGKHSFLRTILNLLLCEWERENFQRENDCERVFLSRSPENFYYK